MLHPASYIPPSNKRDYRTFFLTEALTSQAGWHQYGCQQFFYFPTKQENFTCAYNITPLVYKVYIYVCVHVCMYVCTYCMYTRAYVNVHIKSGSDVNK